MHAKVARVQAVMTSSRVHMPSSVLSVLKPAKKRHSKESNQDLLRACVPSLKPRRVPPRARALSLSSDIPTPPGCLQACTCGGKKMGHVGCHVATSVKEPGANGRTAQRDVGARRRSSWSWVSCVRVASLDAPGLAPAAAPPRPTALHVAPSHAPCLRPAASDLAAPRRSSRARRCSPPQRLECRQRLWLRPPAPPRRVRVRRGIRLARSQARAR